MVLQFFSQNYSTESYYMMADERNSPRIDSEIVREVRNINISAFQKEIWLLSTFSSLNCIRDKVQMLKHNYTKWTCASIYNCEETDLKQTLQWQKYSNSLSD